MVKKAALKTAGISMAGFQPRAKVFDGQTPPEAAPAAALPSPARPVGKPFTGVGSVMAAITREADLTQELAGTRAALGTAQEQLAQWRTAELVQALDARSVRRSQWANRIEAEFSTPEFAELKHEIAGANGNVQPIKVRRIAGAATVFDGQTPLYEIVFGHRRHRACLELGLPVLAMVEDLPEQQLFEQMERENRARADLSAWEQGMMYARALDRGLYPSNRQLAQAIGRDLGDVGKALSLARLPVAVVQAFRSPLDLQYRWAKPLADAQQRDPDGLVARARELKAQSAQRSPKQVFDALVGIGTAGADRAKAAPDIGVRVAGRQVAVVCSDERGHTLVRFAKGLGAAQRQGLAAALEAFLAAAGGKA